MKSVPRRLENVRVTLDGLAAGEYTVEYCNCQTGASLRADTAINAYLALANNSVQIRWAAAGLAPSTCCV